jgi:hypothetical protein
MQYTVGTTTIRHKPKYRKLGVAGNTSQCHHVSHYHIWESQEGKHGWYKIDY